MAGRPLRRPRRRHRRCSDPAGICTDSYPPTGNSEHLDVTAAFADVAQIVSLGSLPMAVITATHREACRPGCVRSRPPQRGVEPGPAGLDGAVDLRHLVSVDDTGHHIEIDQPGVVIDEITHLLP